MSFTGHVVCANMRRRQDFDKAVDQWTDSSTTNMCKGKVTSLQAPAVANRLFSATASSDSQPVLFGATQGIQNKIQGFPMIHVGLFAKLNNYAKQCLRLNTCVLLL